MAAITHTFETFEGVGIKEDLSDVIYNISPTDTPFFNNAGKGKAKQTHSEWQTDALDAVDTSNARVEGNDVTSFQQVTPTVRLGNYTQISDKTVIISDTMEIVDKAGRKSEISYQLAKRGKELKRDMESAALANQGASAGDDSTARVTGSILAFIKSNVDKASDGANPTYTSTPTGTRTDGTQRAWTETILKNVIQLGWTAGAKFSTLMVGATLKQETSGFAGIATKTYYQSAAKVSAIIGAADVYVSDFGTLSVVPNRFMRTRDALLFDWEYVQIAYLRPFQQVQLAKTGDAEKRHLKVEWMVKVLNEKALGLAADLS